ncbi:unnamed protein product, partial [Sphagnum compactum]
MASLSRAGVVRSLMPRARLLNSGCGYTQKREQQLLLQECGQESRGSGLSVRAASCWWRPIWTQSCVSFGELLEGSRPALEEFRYLVKNQNNVRTFAALAFRMRQKAKEKGGNISSNRSKRDSLAGRKEASFAGRRQKSSREASGDGDDLKFRFSAKRKRSAGASVAAGYQDAPESKRSRLKETKPRHPALGRTSSFVHPRQRMDRVDGLRQKKAGHAKDRGGRRLPEVEDAEQPRGRQRRIMRLHPSDQTSKRLVDGAASPAPSHKSEQYGEQDLELSKNATFRAIQPSSQLLRHIDDHLLGRRRLVEWRNGGYHTDLRAPLDNVPHGSTEGWLPIQETVFKRKLTFVAAAKKSSSLPPQQLPEIAFAGRSNVGKSSLINALTRQWGVVRTSDKPGLTQSINFFTLGSRLCLVDLPGYGFAYAKEEIKDAWDDLVKEYVTTRKGLKRVCMLVDARWGLKPRDEELLYLMDNAQTKFQIVLTKTDVLSPIDLARSATQIQQALKGHKCLVLPMMMVSSQTGAGIPYLRKVLGSL